MISWKQKIGPRSRILRIDVNRIPDQNSWAYDQIVEGIANDKIKGLWVVATNSSHSWINQARFNEIVQKLDFLVVQDMYFTTETAQRAHLVLPAAGWGEKAGTFINSERRIGLVKKVSRASGQALSDFNIFKLVAQYWYLFSTFLMTWPPSSAFQSRIRSTANSGGAPCHAGSRGTGGTPTSGILWAGVDSNTGLSVESGLPFRSPEDTDHEEADRLANSSLFYGRRFSEAPWQLSYFASSRSPSGSTPNIL
jgi:hypothetical protein